MIGTAVAMALLGRNHALEAQTTNSDAASKDNLEEIVVTGIRKSMEQSIEQKRTATDIVEVVTAEDIGKMPDKNVADSLARLPGITTSSAGANEGGFDENDRVSMRGTNPSLTQTLINGHNVAAGDWFVLDQTGTVGRSVSYTLLPSEIVSKVVVREELQRLAGRGRRRRLRGHHHAQAAGFLRKQHTLEASAGAVYADLPDKVDRQYSALGNWKNDEHNFGVMVQLFSETRDLRRDGMSCWATTRLPRAATWRWPHPEPLPVSSTRPDRRGALQAGAPAQRRHARCRVQAQRRAHHRPVGLFFQARASNVNDNYLLWSTALRQRRRGHAANGAVRVRAWSPVTACRTIR